MTAGKLEKWSENVCVRPFMFEITWKWN